MSVRPGADAYAHDGDDVAVLLCHGFTSNPASLRPWAESLAAAGRTVRVPRLPGHGTSWRDLGRTTWADWSGELEAAFDELRPRARAVVVGGLSMGGALALQLAQRRGPGVDGLVLVNPALRVEWRGVRLLPVARWVLPWVPPAGNDIAMEGVVEDAYLKIPPHAAHSMLQGFRSVGAGLAGVTQPLLLFRSATDHVLPASSSAMVLEGVSSVDTEEIVLPNSFHVATLDHDAPVIFERSLKFTEHVAHLAGSR